MGNLKADFKPLTDWIEIKLDLSPEVMDPPTLKVKLAPSSMDELQDLINPSGPNKISGMLRQVISDAIMEWDLTLNGEAVPCTGENKRKYLRHLVGQRVLEVNGQPLRKDIDGIGTLLGGQILEISGDPKNFLKN